MLTERFAWLVEAHGVDPDAILAITFTEKAANEIKSRLIQRFAGRPQSRETREAIERAWVSTIHGFCARVLQENAIRAGLPPDFKVLDQPAADRLEREAAEAIPGCNVSRAAGADASPAGGAGSLDPRRWPPAGPRRESGDAV